MARRHGPAPDAGVVHDDAVPPKQRQRIGLLERELLELAHQAAALRLVEGAGLGQVEIVELAVVELVGGCRPAVGREKLDEAGGGIVAVVGVGVDDDVERLRREGIDPGRRLQRLVLGLDPDPAPLVDQEHADGRIGRDIAVGERQREVLCPGLLEQAARLGAVGLDIAAIAGILVELRLRGRPLARLAARRRRRISGSRSCRAPRRRPSGRWQGTGRAAPVRHRRACARG